MTKLTRTVRTAVYLVGSRFGARDYERFGVPKLLAQGIKVIVLDVSAIVHPSARQDVTAAPSSFDCDVRVIGDADGLRTAADVLAKADIAFGLFTDGTVTRHNLPVLRAISRAGTPLCLLCEGAQPGVANHKGDARALPKRIADIARRLPVIEVRDSLIARMPIRLLGLRPARFAVFGGRRSVRATQLIGNETQAIYAHTLDYDRILAMRELPIADEPIAVFIDQDLPNHRDWVLLKGHGAGNPGIYYRGLNRLFERIERELGFEVVIAAHPRALARTDGPPFGPRRIEYGRTQELVRRARLVTTFTSLASNFAVLAGKPLLVLATRSFYRSPAGRRYVEPLARETGSKHLFLEDVERWVPSTALHVDRDAYAQYIENYIKIPGTPERPLWDIALDAINANLSADGVQIAKAAENARIFQTAFKGTAE